MEKLFLLSHSKWNQEGKNKQPFTAGSWRRMWRKAAKEIAYDFSGVDAAKNEHDLYGLRYAEFVVPLVKAVQELSKQNDELKKETEEQKRQSTIQKKQNEELLKRIEKLESSLISKK